MTADDMRNAGVRTEKLSYAVQGTSFHFYLLSAKSLKLTAMPTPMLSKSAHILLHIHSSLIFLGLCIPFLSSGNLPDFHPQDGKPLDSFAYFRPFCVSKLFERIILSHLLFFLKLTPFFSPHQAGFRLVPCILNQIYIFLSLFWMSLTNLSRALRQSLVLSIFFKSSDFVWHPTFFHQLISAGLPP